MNEWMNERMNEWTNEYTKPDESGLVLAVLPLTLNQTSHAFLYLKQYLNLRHTGWQADGFTTVVKSFK